MPHIVDQKCNYVILRTKLDVNLKKTKQESRGISVIAELIVHIIICNLLADNEFSF